MVKTKGIIKDKKGWVTIVEVFISIGLLIAVLLVVINKTSTSNTELRDQIDNKETAILMDIELNNQMRTEIVEIAQSSLPVDWASFNSTLPDVASRINTLTPKNLECRAEICLLNDVCLMNWSPGGDVYAKAVVIAADLNTYSPRQLKLFCTLKSS